MRYIHLVVDLNLDRSQRSQLPGLGQHGIEGGHKLRGGISQEFLAGCGEVGLEEDDQNRVPRVPPAQMWECPACEPEHFGNSQPGPSVTCLRGKVQSSPALPASATPVALLSCIWEQKLLMLPPTLISSPIPRVALRPKLTYFV